MGLKIIKVKEPDNSCKIIKTYEKKFNIPSHKIYNSHMMGVNLIDNEDIISDWVFYYKIYINSLNNINKKEI